MAFHSENNNKLQEEVIEHFSSAVVEGISVLSSLMKRNNTVITPILTELTKGSRLFLEKWEKSCFDFSMLLSMLIPLPYFHDMKLFIEKMSHMEHDDFLYHFFAEDIPASQLKQLLAEPSAIYSFEPSHWWRTEKEKREFIELASTIDVFRKNLQTILLEITHSSVFNSEMANKESLLNQQMAQLKSYEMEGLALAQYVMGKPFRRTSLYETFYFVPSNFFNP